MVHEPTRQDDARHYAGAVIVGIGLGRPLNFVSLEGGVDWLVPAVVLSTWGDFLDFAHAEAMIAYGAALAEKVATGEPDDLRDLRRWFHAGRSASEPRDSREKAVAELEAEARGTVETLLEGWRDDHPDVVAYVEEWLDWPELRHNTEEALLKAWEGASRLAMRLLERGSLTGAEAKDVLAHAVFEQALRDAAVAGRDARREGGDP